MTHARSFYLFSQSKYQVSCLAMCGRVVVVVAECSLTPPLPSFTMSVVPVTTGVRVPLPAVSVIDLFLETIVLQQIRVGPTR